MVVVVVFDDLTVVVYEVNRRGRYGQCREGGSSSVVCYIGRCYGRNVAVVRDVSPSTNNTAITVIVCVSAVVIVIVGWIIIIIVLLL